VIQSISSVIQALPPDEEIPPIEVRWFLLCYPLFGTDSDMSIVWLGYRESDCTETRGGIGVLRCRK
jgi:hypothetical protein